MNRLLAAVEKNGVGPDQVREFLHKLGLPDDDRQLLIYRVARFGKIEHPNFEGYQKLRAFLEPSGILGEAPEIPPVITVDKESWIMRRFGDMQQKDANEDERLREAGGPERLEELQELENSEESEASPAR